MQFWFTFLGRFQNLVQKRSLCFQLCVTLPGKFLFYAVKRKKKKSIGERMLPVPREDKVELLLKVGSPQELVEYMLEH